MPDVILPARVFRLERVYERKQIKLLWLALNYAKQEVPGGRDAFSSHIDDILRDMPEQSSIVLSDGTRYEIPEIGPTSKTISNFLSSPASIFDPEFGTFSARDELTDSTDSIARRINASNETLRYIHLYLWLRYPERVSKWEATQIFDLEHDFIENLDDNFEMVSLKNTLPKYAKFYRTDKLYKKRPQGIKMASSDNDLEPNLKRKELIGFAKFEEVKSSVESRCTYISFESYISYADKMSGKSKIEENEKFSRQKFIHFGKSIAFKNKNVIFRVHEYKPLINIDGISVI